MNRKNFKMTVEESASTIPRVWWEKMFYFDGVDGHRVIYGHHIAGGFFAISNYKIYCEASEFAGSMNWNYDSLVGAGVREEYALAIAKYVEDFNKTHAAEISAAQNEEYARMRASASR